jgi:hypothetical protein
MSANFPKSQQYCATCMFWEGERKTNTPRTYSVLPKGGATKGKCILKSITTTGASSPKCNKWVAWGILV